jgi:hypothetical protein
MLHQRICHRPLVSLHLPFAMRGGRASKQLFWLISRKRSAGASPNTFNRVRRVPSAFGGISSLRSLRENFRDTICLVGERQTPHRQV